MNMKKQLAQLPIEYFQYQFTDRNMPKFKRSTFWLLLYLMVYFNLMSIAFTNTMDIDPIPIVRYSNDIYWILLAMWVPVCLFFTSKKNVLRFKPAYILCCIAAFGMFRITILRAITAFAAGQLCYVRGGIVTSAVHVIYDIGYLIIIEDILLNYMAWRYTQRCILDGHFREEGGGFFGKFNDSVPFLALFLEGLAPSLISIWAFTYFMQRIHIFSISSGSSFVIPVIIILFIVHQLLLYIFAYADSMLLGRRYYLKRFEREAMQAELAGYEEDTAAEGDSLGQTLLKLLIGVLIIFSALLALYMLY